ncbi:MAG: purine-binding chemotaxis protein CheW [Deltaproteobacteria bacterium]|nr:purine-binding chemotaxis protein CheW [Deltaproteobacteria bacterium]
MQQQANDWTLDINEEDEDAMANRYLLFHVASEDYGIGIENVIEIIGLQKVTEVPDMPHYVKGVINLRGQVIPVVDIRLRFGIVPKEYTDRTCVIVVQIKEMNIGIIVDGMAEVQEIQEAQISPPSPIQKNVASKYIYGMGRVGEEVKILLDVGKLLFEDDFMDLENEQINLEG